MTNTPSSPDDLLTPAEVCEILRVPNTRLQDWRLVEGRGPAFIRLGKRTVRYRRSAVDAFLARFEVAEGGE